VMAARRLVRPGASDNPIWPRPMIAVRGPTEKSRPAPCLGGRLTRIKLAGLRPSSRVYAGHLGRRFVRAQHGQKLRGARTDLKPRAQSIIICAMLSSAAKARSGRPPSAGAVYLTFIARAEWTAGGEPMGTPTWNGISGALIAADPDLPAPKGPLEPDGIAAAA